ncbi:MAG: RraA family protein [Burkholderiaceae bacterium]
MKLTAELAVLTQYDTPTICNALELIVPQRRATGFTIEHMVCRDPAMPPMVGYARTATIRAVTPAQGEAAALREHRFNYYRYIAQGGPTPSIVIIQDLDPVPGFGAFWGEVNTAIHKGLHCQGVVTNGSIRDLPQCAPGFQLLAGKVGPSHAHVHIVDYGKPVNVFGMAVNDGDVIHADGHGAVVIPAEAIDRIPAAVDLLVRREAVILDCARGDGFDIEKLRQAMSTSADIH